MRNLLLLSVLAAGTLGATQHALLVGVSSYASSDRLSLEGPRHDIAAFRRILVERFRLAPENIHELLDRKATKANILGELQTRVAELKPRDSLLIYFSGHGTSAFDAGFRPLASLIGPNSGALVPHDFDSSTPQTIAQTLIIGRRDLRPILERAQPQATVFIILDSCYSGNAAKAVGEEWEGPQRAIQLVNELSGAAKKSTRSSSSRATGSFDTSGLESAAPAAPLPEEPDEYPYKNVIAFSAASKNEPARDINTQLIRTGRFETFDGLPHGAFTNSLLAALDGSADTNRDGNFTYGELFRFIRQDIQQFHKQTPQVQLPAESMLDQVALSSRSTAATRPASAAQKTPSAAAIRVAVQGASPEELARIQAIPGVAITTAAHDLLLQRRPGNWSLFRSSHALVRRYADSELETLVARIQAQKEVQQLETLTLSAPSFSLALDAKPVARASASGAPFASRFAVGEEFSLVVSLERSAYLLLLDIDPAGSVSILLPSPKEPQPVVAQSALEILRARASAPAGSEVLRGFAFLIKPAGLDEFSCQSQPNGLSCPQLEPGTPAYSRLLQLLRQAGSLQAAATLRLETID